MELNYINRVCPAFWDPLSFKQKSVKTVVNIGFEPADQDLNVSAMWISCSSRALIFVAGNHIPETAFMITVIAGTNRPDNNSLRIANVCQQMLTDLGEETQVLSLEDVPQDFAFRNAVYGQEAPEMAELTEQYIAPVDRLVIIAAEYNGSYPGILKAFIDAVHPDHWRGKKAALVGISSGRSGNVRGLEHLTGVLHYLQVEVCSAKPVISGIDGLLAGEELKNKETIDVLWKQAEAFLAF